MGVSDLDIRHKTIRVTKAWERDGEDGEQDTPGWLHKQLRAKHVMGGHHLGKPKKPKSRRTIEISDEVVGVLTRLVAGRATDDFVFTTPTGLTAAQQRLSHVGETRPEAVGRRQVHTVADVFRALEPGSDPPGWDPLLSRAFRPRSRPRYTGRRRPGHPGGWADQPKRRPELARNRGRTPDPASHQIRSSTIGCVVVEPVSGV